MAKRMAESESELQPIAKSVRFGDAGTPHRLTPAVGKRRLRLQQISPRRVRMQQIKSSLLRRAIKANVTVLKPDKKALSAASLVEAQFLLQSLLGCLRNLTAVLPSLFYIATCSSAISSFFPRSRMTVSR